MFVRLNAYLRVKCIYIFPMILNTRNSLSCFIEEDGGQGEGGEDGRKGRAGGEERGVGSQGQGSACQVRVGREGARVREGERDSLIGREGGEWSVGEK